jgi:amino acid adenylation domain-containing protein/non-ribosomal peptide synthase protein (TIGR01720 family)
MRVENIQDIYGLSPAQQGILFHSLYAPEESVYFIQLSYTLHGKLNVLAFERAWRQVLDWHPVLRTAFYWENLEQPLQVVYQQVELPWEQHDWREIALVEQQERWSAFLQADRHQGFDVSQAPLMRLTLIQLAEDTYQFVWSKHHLILDGWSTALVLKQVVEVYEALCQNRDLPSVSSPPYGDYIAWLQQQDLSPAEVFWRQLLKGFTAPTPLLIGRDVASLSSVGYNDQQIKLSKATTAALQSLARQHQLTLNTLIQGAWALLLSHYSGEADVVFGATVSGRPATLAQVESMVGVFINTLPVRVRVSPQESFLSWLLQLQKQQVEARQYEYSPLVQVQGWSEIPRGVPLFETILVFENYPIDSSVQVLLEQGNNLTIENVCSSEQTNYPLTLVVEVGSVLSLRMVHDLHRFDADVVARMLGHLQALLEGAIANPHQSLRDLSLLTEAERHQLLVAWNDTQADYPKDQCIQALFEAQVERSPDAVAVVFEDQQLTYQQLNQRANQLAHHLRKLGVGPEVLVGLCMERSLEMTIGLLGILKAGGAYVPLDPSYPKERSAFMLVNSQAPVLLTQQRLVEMLPQQQTKLVCLDTDWENITQEPKDNPVSGATPENLAYTIYTSGSTGKPKGVQVLHRAVVNFLTSMRLSPGLTDQDTLLSVTTLSFDIAALELFLPLIVGARVVVASREVGADGAQLLKLLADSAATVMQATPATWRLLLESGWQGNHQLKILCGGEALPQELAKQLLIRGATLWNLYGPTETTIWSAIHQVKAEEGSVPIGRPIANTQIYLLDRHLQPVPIGVPGELCIGGDGLTRGYLNRPDLVAEKFIPSPYSTLQQTAGTPAASSQEPGARLYRTGDLARYRFDGTIEFLGRIDHQVKIRGFRIELGEIEAVLSQHPAVRAIAVAAIDTILHSLQGDVFDSNENRYNQRLVAYVVPHQQSVPTTSELRRFLKEQLPDYMVPTAFVMLDTLPLTPNGKVDRRALPAPDTASRSDESVAYVAPRTPVEQKLTAIWALVLGLDRVSIYDNFFELGGHSLLATQLIAKVHEAFQVQLPLRSLFELPTIASFSEQIYQIQNSGAAPQEPAIVPLSRQSRRVTLSSLTGTTDDSLAFPASFAQQRLWFLDQLEPGSSKYNIFAAVRISGQLNVTTLEQSFNELVQRHEALRTTFATVDGQPVQVIHPMLDFRLSIVDFTTTQNPTADIQNFLSQEVTRPFNLGRGPLLRAMLLKLGEQEHVLLLTLHHIVSDGWSMGVLVQELAALYEAFAALQPASLPPLPIQYADFAVWQRQWLEEQALLTQLAYWKEQLDGLTQLQLLTDRPRSLLATSQSEKQTLVLSKTLTEGLKTLSQQAGVTLFMTLLAAFKTLLHRYTAQDDIVVGSPIANRTRSETQGLIGLFVNTLVLRTDMSSNPTFRELLNRICKVTLEAYDRQDLPFEKLVDELQPERDLSRNPLFQVWFALNNAPLPTLQVSGLTLSPLEVERSQALFDLSLDMVEQDKELIASVEYSTDLFDSTTITRMLGHFQVLLQGIIANPDWHLSDLPLLTETEQHQLLVWSRGVGTHPEVSPEQVAIQEPKSAVDYRQCQCIHQLFEAQVERSPDQVAVIFEEQQLTYQELNQRANKIAHHLQKLGVGPEVLVGICVERSLEMVVGILGILKSGSAYVPLDPAYPQERLAFMLEDAQVPVLLTQERLVMGLPEQKARVICLDADWKAIAQESEKNLLNSTTAKNLAYAIYTSGSTGKSKGVMIQHSSLVNAYLVWEETYQLRAVASCHLQMASFSFDVFSGDLVRALCSGGKLVLCPQELLLAPQQLYELMQKQKVDCADFVPAVLRNLIQYLEESGERLDFMRILVCGSDSWYGSEYKQFRCLCGSETRLINAFGVTEATIDSSYFESAAVDLPVDQVVPIGHPFANTQLYILDSHLQPVPIGILGELHIGGAGLARGYRHRPKLTAEKFIPNPFSTEPGDRLYKTGDLARYLPDGNIEFCGRIDHQVKIRGFRIELGEIEAVLRQHPAVQETVVLDREDISGEKRLVAYVVPKQEATPITSDLHRFLKQQLPDYMVPSVFMLLLALPLSPNGKVDRQALPVPNTVRPELDKAFVAPRTPVEARLVEIWAKVLGVEQVGIHDNFFELGGDSIISIQIVARANQAGLRLTPKQLFQHQTIAELAMVAGTSQAIQTEQGIVTGLLPLTPIQHWFFEQDLLDPHHWNQAILLEVRQPLNPGLLEQAVQQLLVHHDALRLRFERIESGWRQVNASPDEMVPFTLIDLSALQEREQGSALEAKASELQASLNLQEGPLVRVALFECGAQKFSRLLIVIHHLVVDGVSWRILLEDLQTAYQQLSRGEALQLPAKTTSFQQWAYCVREYANSAAQEQRDYWLAEFPRQVPRLPVDYPGGDNTVATVRTVSVTLSESETQALLLEVPSSYNTQINDVLLTALVQAFTQWTGDHSLLVDLEGHGREEIFDDVDLSRTVGWFTTLFPVLLILEEASHPGEAVKAVKEQLRGIPNRGIGYGVLRYLSSDREIVDQLAALPQAEVSFNYFGQFDQTLSESSLFGWAQESTGPAQSQRGKRCHLLDINGFVTGGALRLDWTYSEQLHSRATIESLAQGFGEALRSLIAHCQSPEAGGYTPSDFPDIELSQEQLEKALAEMNLG